MYVEFVQAAQEVAKQSSYINVAIPTALVSSTLALLGREGIAAIVNRKHKKNGNGGPKPGESETCKRHSEDIAVLNEFKDDTKKALEVIGTDIKELLGRVPAR